jgi:seryl-tRNA synthetase
VSALEERRKKNQVETQDLQNLRNTQSKAIGKAKSAGEDIKLLLDAVADLGDKLNMAKSELKNIQQKIDAIVMAMPNLPHKSVPEGNSEDDNVEVLKWGKPYCVNFVNLASQLDFFYAAPLKQTTHQHQKKNCVFSTPVQLI